MKNIKRIWRYALIFYFKTDKTHNYLNGVYTKANLFLRRTLHGFPFTSLKITRQIIEE